MNIAVAGIENQLVIEEPGIGLLNIHNKKLYRSLCTFLRLHLDDTDRNEIVLFDGGARILSKDLLYIQDIDLYSFDTKQIVERIVKTYVAGLQASVVDKEQETEHYKEIINPILEAINLLEVDYDYKEELDSSMYYKMLGVSFEPDEDILANERIKSMLSIESKIFRKRIYIINRALPLLTESDLDDLNTYVKASNCYLLFVDYLADSDVVVTDNLVVDEEYGVYSLNLN